MGRAQEIPGCSYPGLLLKADPRIYCIPKLRSPGDHQARIPRLCSPPGGHQAGVRRQASRKGLNIRSPSPGRLGHGLHHHPSQSKEAGFLQLVNALGRVPKAQEATSSEGHATAVQESIAQVSI